MIPPILFRTQAASTEGKKEDRKEAGNSYPPSVGMGPWNRSVKRGVVWAVGVLLVLAGIGYLFNLWVWGGIAVMLILQIFVHISSCHELDVPERAHRSRSLGKDTRGFGDCVLRGRL